MARQGRRICHPRPRCGVHPIDQRLLWQRGGARPVRARPDAARARFPILMAPHRFDEVLVEATPARLRAAAVADGELVDWLDEPRQSPFAAGSIMLGRVAGGAPDLGAVFIDIGAERPALLDARGRAAATGAIMLVQIAEAPSGDKGGRVTRRLALAGQHAVLLPGGK